MILRVNKYLNPVIRVAAANAPLRERQGADFLCDGVDDDVQIQAAHDELPTSGGGTVRFSQGIFVLNTQVIVTTTGTSFEGQGHPFGSSQDCGTCFECKTGNTFDGYYMMSAQAGNFFTICNIGFDAKGVRSASSGTPVMECLLVVCRDSWVSHCSFYQAGVGIRVSKGDIWIDHNYIEQMESYGIVLSGEVASHCDCNWTCDNVFWNPEAIDIRIRDYVIHPFIMRNRFSDSEYVVRVDGAHNTDLRISDNHMYNKTNTSTLGIIRLNASDTAINRFTFNNNTIKTDDLSANTARLIVSVSGSKISNGQISHNIATPGFANAPFDANTDTTDIEIFDNIGISPIKASGTTDTISVVASGIYTNEGTDGTTHWDLPAALEGMHFKFCRVDHAAGKDVEIDPNGTEHIYLEDGTDVGAGNYRGSDKDVDTYYEITLECFKDGEWRAINEKGTGVSEA